MEEANGSATTGQTYYTLLPSDGSNIAEYLNPHDDFNGNEQNNFRSVWHNDESVTINYSGKTFNGYNEYQINYATGTTYDGQYYLYGTYRKVLDLIATFSPDVLDKFEEYFLDFASERENVEVTYKSFPSYTDDSGYVHQIKYDNFQNLLKELVTVKKDDDDGWDIPSIIDTIRIKQTRKHKNISKEIISVDNMIKITISNPKEINLKNIFNQYKDYDIIFANWAMFHSNGNIKHPKSIVQSCTFRHELNGEMTCLINGSFMPSKTASQKYAVNGNANIIGLLVHKPIVS